jgi:hypothetical protein
MKYKVTNKAKDVRKFRDRHQGKDIFIEPGKSVMTIRPPKESEIWKIEIQEITEKKDVIKLTKEEKNNDSSSSNRRMDGNLSDSNISSRRK